ncbi:ribonuclease E inhibitor RraB [Marinobacter sp. S6332]|uniref:ribonuclease E inhibitor RraB n=1 Tax=Marinobacter sp. S6332 TaxID=2926403 RepID=UPI001FF13376|nr:ribonuclease E inhibitor RraB [Marinobacter sp. S6332]MCK0162902.1 ribonuclease E inhibitor RraB [Marinobacter sp. S6332]
MNIFKSLFGRADKDEQVLKALKKNGSDLNKPHEIDFWFDFRSEESARAVAKKVAERGFEVEVYRGEYGLEFSCKAVKRMVPRLSAMQRLTREFESIAEQHAGVYDGWGAEVVT